ncbi:hypothetical protein KGQ64_03240 [bacterium]|nr:hypothetical protein [bacterium]
MSAPTRLAVLAGEPAAGSPLRPEDLADRVASLGDGIGLQEVRAAAAVGEILWLPPWAHLDDRLARGLERFRSGTAEVASAAPLLRDPDATIRLRRTVLVAKPGAARVLPTGLAPLAGARASVFDETLEVRPPGLSGHLSGIDRQAEVCARLLEEAGVRASGARLAAAPIARLLSAMARSSGDRRAALARATLEAFREVLVQAKLWERASVDAGVD